MPLGKCLCFSLINEHEKSKSNNWDSFLNDIADDEGYIFVERIFDLFDDNNELSEFVLFKQWNGSSLFQAFCKKGDIEALQHVLFDKRIQSDNDKCKSLAHLFVSEIPSTFSDTLKALRKGRKGANDAQNKILNRFSMIFDLYKHHQKVEVFQHKAFNYFTVRTPVYDNTEFKVVEDTLTHFTGGLRCFGYGYDGDGRLGLGNGQSISEPTICTALIKKKILKISSYDAHSLCIDAEGCTYSWGNNKFGQLGLGDGVHEDISTPQILDVLRPYKALNVSVGANHSLILTDDGNVWACGEWEYGALGYVSKENVLSPKIIDSLKNEHIVHVSCGHYHSCVISKDGKLITFGSNEYGQCGVGNNKEKIFVPTNVVLADGLIPAFAAGGQYHTLILTANHMVLSCGQGKNGRLGHGNEDNQNAPKMIEALQTKRIINVACGYSGHSLCVSNDGELYTFGDGFAAKLGHGNEDQQLSPKVVQFFKDKNIKIRECAAGWFHSGAISTNDEVYLWGRGVNGTLGKGPDDMEERAVPTKVEYFTNMPVNCISLGGVCSFVVSDGIEEKEDEVGNGNEWILKGDQEMNISNQNDLRNKSFVEVFVRNRTLFGDLKWVMFRKNKEYSAFPFYTTSFIDSLEVTKDGSIELIDLRGIHKRYNREILRATYLLLVNEENAEIKREYVENNKQDELHVFGDKYPYDLQNIKFKMPSNEKGKGEFTVGVYVQPAKGLNFFLLKQFCIK